VRDDREGASAIDLFCGRIGYGFGGSGQRKGEGKVRKTLGGMR
jgi:hypothetical protein